MRKIILLVVIGLLAAAFSGQLSAAQTTSGTAFKDRLAVRESYPLDSVLRA